MSKRRGNKPFIDAPEGHKGCCRCLEVKPASAFVTKKVGGLESYCRPCKQVLKLELASRFSWDISEKIIARFRAKIAPQREDTGCIEWTGCKDKNGYGLFFFNGRQLGAHRIAWHIAGNEVPEWPQVIDHRCYNVACVNVQHLRVVEQFDNVNRYARRQPRQALSGFTEPK